MKISNIFLGLVGVAFVGTQVLKTHVNNIIENGSYKGEKAPVSANLTGVETVCYLSIEGRTFGSAYYVCSTEAEAKYRDAQVRTRNHVTYNFRFGSPGKVFTDSSYLMEENVKFELIKGKSIPILVGVEDPTYSHFNYAVMESRS